MRPGLVAAEPVAAVVADAAPQGGCVEEPRHHAAADDALAPRRVFLHLHGRERQQLQLRNHRHAGSPLTMGTARAGSAFACLRLAHCRQYGIHTLPGTP